MLSALEIKTLHAPAVVTATAESAAVDLNDYEGPITVILHSTASGTGITNTPKLQECATSGGTYTDVADGGFTAVANTASSQAVRVNSDNLMRYLKLDFVVAGGTGEGVVAASVIGKKKYK